MSDPKFVGETGPMALHVHTEHQVLHVSVDGAETFVGDFRQACGTLVAIQRVMADMDIDIIGVEDMGGLGATFN